MAEVVSWTATDTLSSPGVALAAWKAMMIDVPAGTFLRHEFLFGPGRKIAGGELHEVPVEDRGVQDHVGLPRFGDIERERDIRSLVQDADVLAEETQRGGIAGRRGRASLAWTA